MKRTLVEKEAMSGRLARFHFSHSSEQRYSTLAYLQAHAVVSQLITYCEDKIHPRKVGETPSTTLLKKFKLRRIADAYKHAQSIDVGVCNDDDASARLYIGFKGSDYVSTLSVFVWIQHWGHIQRVETIP